MSWRGRGGGSLPAATPSQGPVSDTHGRNTAVMEMAGGMAVRREKRGRAGLLSPQGSCFLLYTQRIALYSQVGLNLVYIKEIEHLFCVGLFFSSCASPRVPGKSINKDPALFSLCG